MTKNTMTKKKLFGGVFILLTISYPIGVYFGLSYFAPRCISLVIMLVFVLRFILISYTTKFSIQNTVFLVALVGIGIGLLGAISNQDLIMKLYPVLINLLMFGVFFHSALYPPTVIERLARLKSPNLPNEAIKYTTKVTLVWCGFFIINGAIALWTAVFATAKSWAFYNGFLAYIFIGVLFVTEFTYRQWAKRKNYLSKL